MNSVSLSRMLVAMSRLIFLSKTAPWLNKLKIRLDGYTAYKKGNMPQAEKLNKEKRKL